MWFLHIGISMLDEVALQYDKYSNISDAVDGIVHSHTGNYFPHDPWSH